MKYNTMTQMFKSIKRNFDIRRKKALRIDIDLCADFVDYFNVLRSYYGDELAVLNGLGKNQLNYTSFIDNFVDKKTVADASIDGNANVGHKDIVTLENEMGKPHSKLLGFNKIFYEMEKKYGPEEARKWLLYEWIGYFYMHDAYNSTFKPYCYAYTLEKLVNETGGLYFIDKFNHKAPAHLTTYTDFVGEFISWNCNRTSGAVGLPDFLVYSYYFWKKDVESGDIIRNPEYYRYQSFQEIIYRMNEPFLRNSIQSA